MWIRSQPHSEQIMEQAQLLGDIMAEGGLVAVDRLTAVLRVTRGELAQSLGLSRDSVAKLADAGTPATQARLRDMVEILSRVRPWAGSPLQAFAWYRSQPIPSFGDQTAEALVKEGRGEDVKRYLDRIEVGGYA
jgi:hypothetical protein